MNETNPYQTPQAQVGDRFEGGEAGGNLEAGIAGQYDFQIGAVLSEAWEKTKGFKGTFWGAFILIYLIMFVAMMILGVITGGLMVALDDPIAGMIIQMVLQLVIMAALMPFMVGILMMGVNRAAGLPVSFNMAFGYYHLIVPVFISTILITIFIYLGMFLLILPGIYLSFAYALVLPLIAEKNLGPWQAMEASRRALTHRWFKVFGLFIVMTLIMFASFIVIIGWIWTYPMMINVMGVLYRTVFGVEEARG